MNTALRPSKLVIYIIHIMVQMHDVFIINIEQIYNVALNFMAFACLTLYPYIGLIVIYIHSG